MIGGVGGVIIGGVGIGGVGGVTVGSLVGPLEPLETIGGLVAPVPTKLISEEMA
jgi:hypothetical protein